MATQPQKIGIDLGMTIVNTRDESRRAFPDALRVIKRLIEHHGPANVFIVSRVNEVQMMRAKAWLLRMKFHDETGLPAENVIFCAERHEKAPICQRLDIKTFVDDRPEVLSHMQGIVPRRILFGGVEEDVILHREQNMDVVRVETWGEIERLLL